MNSLILFATILAVFPEFGLQGEVYTVNKITYYVEESRAYSWNKAVIECGKRDMHLATFESKEEFNDVNKQVWSSNSAFWVGAIGDPITYTYTWSTTGKSVIGSMFDAERGTGNDPSSFCVTFDAGLLINEACQGPYGFICRENKPLINCCEKKSNVFVNIKQN